MRKIKHLRSRQFTNQRRALPVVTLNRNHVHNNFLFTNQNLFSDPLDFSTGDVKLPEGGLSEISDNLLDQTLSSGIADGRLFTPSSITMAPATKSGAVSYRVKNAWRLADIGFERPQRVLICLRRKRRKEVLFAKGVAGQRGRKKRPRYNRYSFIRC